MKAKTHKYLEGLGKAQIDRIVMGKMKIGVDLLQGIEEIAKSGNIRTGVILSGIGALGRGAFRNAKEIPPDYKVEDKHRVFLNIEQPLELTSLSGWIATTAENETNVHAHFMTTTVMDGKVVSLGGHLVPGTITSIKVVVVIGVLEGSTIKAALDTRLNQIDVSFGI